MNENVRKFAELLIRHVRDEAIQSCDGLLKSMDKEHMSVIAKRWKKARESGDLDSFMGMVIADTVDDTLFQLLHSIDESLLSLMFAGVDLLEAGEGEMAGEFMTEWREALSSERSYDDFSDL